MSHRQKHTAHRWAARSLPLLLLLGAALAAAATESTNSFIRFVPADAKTGRVETAIKTYRNSDGIEVSLFSAIHVADRSYYEDLQRRFKDCDALLYEMIRDNPDGSPQPDVDTANTISQLQIGMKKLLGLEFQLDVVDYSPKNFVHADLDPGTFFRLQDERNESFLSLLVRLMLEEQSRINTGEGTTVSSFGFLFALMNPDRAYALKLVMAQQMGELERMMAGIDDGPDGKGSVIVSARNEHALKVLQKQIDTGKRRLGIFYGAGHMVDFQERLLNSGYRPIREEWIPAWDIAPTR
jgi:hypothetical protein